MDIKQKISEVKNAIFLIERTLSFPMNTNRISKELNELKDDKIKLQTKLSTLQEAQDIFIGMIDKVEEKKK